MRSNVRLYPCTSQNKIKINSKAVSVETALLKRGRSYTCDSMVRNMIYSNPVDSDWTLDYNGAAVRTLLLITSIY